MNERWLQRHGQGEHLIPALNAAIDEVIETQLDALAIQRRYVSDMREIWLMQPRFEKRQPATISRLMEHIRFRAAYDFMLLRAEAGLCDASLAQWWQAYLDADTDERSQLIAQTKSHRLPAGSPRRRRRRKPGATSGGTESSGSGPSD